MPIPPSPKGRNTPRRAGASVAVLAFGTMLAGVAIDLVLPAVVVILVPAVVVLWLPAASRAALP
jgi:hypothetical protein